MAQAQKPDFVFRRNGRVHLNRRGRQFSWLLAAEVCTSAVVMLETPCSEVVWRVLDTHSILQFPLHFPSLASPCAITFQLESTYKCLFFQFSCDLQDRNLIQQLVFQLQSPETPGLMADRISTVKARGASALVAVSHSVSGPTPLVAQLLSLLNFILLNFICPDVFHISYKVYLFSIKHIYLLLLKVHWRRHVSALSGHLQALL
jgi:hypothetical protein